MIQHMYTRQGEKLTGIPWKEYPRPQMVREGWQCLNGTWRFGTDPEMKEEILVPFCPESLLSGIRRDLKKEKDFFYERRFTLELPREGRRILLHFGAVDQIAEVWLNGEKAGRHIGGYLPFTLDITDRLTEGENVLRVEVRDALSHQIPWGKQKKKRGGMWYTPVSGIWQTVWLESVPRNYIRALRISNGPNWVRVRVDGMKEGRLTLEDSGESFPIEDGSVRFTVNDPDLWSPEHPRLYYFTVRCGEDEVRSYFALRELSVRMVKGVLRLCLNGKPYFFHGLLDQGYYSDGIYTPAVPELYTEDILAMKFLGFNTLRKHIKIEPERFYYDCDRLGMIVFQDMVNVGDYHFLRDSGLPRFRITKLSDQHMNPDQKARRNFLLSMKETVKHLYNHPCICYWTIFNEGWGQFCADKAYEVLLKLDPSRFIDATSGWFKQERSDVESQHIYFYPLSLGETARPQMLSEFGGFVWKDPEHSANPRDTYGYRVYGTREEMVAALREIYLEEVLPLAKEGLCGSIYTQVSDVEDETNGLLTYDRRLQKISPEEFADIGVLLQAAVRE